MGRQLRGTWKSLGKFLTSFTCCLHIINMLLMQLGRRELNDDQHLQCHTVPFFGRQTNKSGDIHWCIR